MLVVAQSSPINTRRTPAGSRSIRDLNSYYYVSSLDVYLHPCANIALLLVSSAHLQSRGSRRNDGHVAFVFTAMQAAGMSCNQGKQNNDDNKGNAIASRHAARTHGMSDNLHLMLALCCVFLSNDESTDL